MSCFTFTASIHLPWSTHGDSWLIEPLCLLINGRTEEGIAPQLPACYYVTTLITTIIVQDLFPIFYYLWIVLKVWESDKQHKKKYNTSKDLNLVIIQLKASYFLTILFLYIKKLITCNFGLIQVPILSVCLNKRESAFVIIFGLYSMLIR